MLCVLGGPFLYIYEEVETLLKHSSRKFHSPLYYHTLINIYHLQRAQQLLHFCFLADLVKSLIPYGSPVHRSPHHQLSAHMEPLHYKHALYPYFHTYKHIHCHSKQRDVKRRCRQSFMPLQGTAAEQPTYDVIGHNGGPSGSKMKEATFQHLPPCTYGQCTHILGTR